MRIIENPNPQEETIVTCSKCKCKFGYSRGDVNMKSNGILGPGYHCHCWVNCPNCGETITV